jgi:ubiquinone/menaquinone biosynthesis C-methylase UbiE
MKTDALPMFIRKILVFRRRSRVNFILSKVATADNMKIVDIGCGIDGRSFEDYIPHNWKITGIDILSTERIHHCHPNFIYIQQDAQDLSCFKDKEFDLAVSIGMLEHIIEESAFNRIISEMKRIAKQYIVVVPNKYCWIEPHYGIPFFPILPYSIKLALIKILNLSKQRDVITKDPDFIKKSIKWLSNKEYKRVFPDSRIYLLPTLETIAVVRKSHL